MRTIYVLAAFFLLVSPLYAQQYDLVIQGGRVIDPETGLDATRNIGINGGKIARISEAELSGKRVISAKGLIVSPGFIDLHQHGQDLENQRVKALDGVTTILEMEIGKPDVASFLKSQESHSLLNYGSTASHVAARSLVLGPPLPDTGLLPKSGPATNNHATPEQIAKIKDRLRHEIAAGALGIGMGIQYTPGATRSEIIQMFQFAAENKFPVFTHVRSAGKVEPGSSIESVSEVIGAVAVTGASLHIVHINSSCGSVVPECMQMIAGARARGLDVTTEAYPYEAGMTAINSALFNPGWQEKYDISYQNLMLPETGERLTKERFDELHASNNPQWVITFTNTMQVVDALIPNPLVMIASDGDKGHPRDAGTYSRVLSRYVRELGTVTLMDAIRKMSLMPAQWLEKSTPDGRKKGRVQEGADADITVFDLQTIKDHSSYQHPMEPSVGVQYLLVGGTVVVDQGKIVPNVFPGRALVGPGKLN
ncbi:MAG TPA: amidohydrolase family protein [Terriglobales bacterium]